ncbi:major facilitator superfamily domain-containing protein [Aspergillus pseudocaelatus]|uniref:Major facilitator superfamily domain-containing protein n=1 Tax=Aspergillus pseudocaelatus TaxID=1825620 RepID=A0ABQ6WGX9_9EURO|nr:major facilitator superfamily domain-containing protein [Aspergillus pseudocaelatus]
MNAEKEPHNDDEKAVHATQETEQDLSTGECTVFQMSPEAERRLLWKLDILQISMIPTMGICYMLQYMDKLALSQATLLNLRQNLVTCQGLVGNEYTWCSVVFYFGYLAGSVPTSYLMVRLPLGKYVSTSVFLWGGILMCHAACQNYGGLVTARFFLGVGEAAVAPGFGLITGMFYKREEQPARQAAWFIGNCIANIIGGVVAWGIGNSASGLQSWRLLFLVLGGITSGYALILCLLLPDSPAKASFLSDSERRIAVQRTLQNKTGSTAVTEEFLWDQVIDAIRDPQAWLLILYTFCVNLANGGLTSFSTIIIAGFGYSNFESLLLQMPMGLCQLIFLILTALMATYVQSSRIMSMILNVIVAVIGVVLIYTLDESHKVVKLVGLCFVATFAANIPLSLSIITSNVAGTTKRSMLSVGLFAAYCVGNIVGPQFFYASQEPVYSSGIEATLCGLALGVFFLGCLFLYYIWENKRRDRQQGVMNEGLDVHDLLKQQNSKTDRQIPGFRYTV